MDILHPKPLNRNFSTTGPMYRLVVTQEWLAWPRSILGWRSPWAYPSSWWLPRSTCALSNVLQETLKLLQRILKSPGCRKIPVLVNSKEDVVMMATNFSSERYEFSRLLQSILFRLDSSQRACHSFFVAGPGSVFCHFTCLHVYIYIWVGDWLAPVKTDWAPNPDPPPPPPPPLPVWLIVCVDVCDDLSFLYSVSVLFEYFSYFFIYVHSLVMIMYWRSFQPTSFCFVLFPLFFLIYYVTVHEFY